MRVVDKGTRERRVDAASGGNGIDAREILIGPIVASIPSGHLLLVNLELRVPPQPPALPGSTPSPCKAVAVYLEVDDARKAREEKISYPADCDRLLKTGGSDYDVQFPDVRVARRADGLYVRYVWIRFRGEQGPPYLSYPHDMKLKWQLVSTAPERTPGDGGLEYSSGDDTEGSGGGAVLALALGLPLAAWGLSKFLKRR